MIDVRKLILIESQWNLKDECLEYGLIDEIDINRITVEFKGIMGGNKRESG